MSDCQVSDKSKEDSILSECQVSGKSKEDSVLSDCQVSGKSKEDSVLSDCQVSGKSKEDSILSVDIRYLQRSLVIFINYLYTYHDFIVLFVMTYCCNYWDSWLCLLLVNWSVGLLQTWWKNGQQISQSYSGAPDFKNETLIRRHVDIVLHVYIRFIA